MKSVLLLGLLIGMRHALEADHLAAVASLATRGRGMRGTVLRGAVWGLGHTLTLAVVGGICLLLNASVPERLSRVLEMAVGAMLLALGAEVLWRLYHAHRHAAREVHNPGHRHHPHPEGFPGRSLVVGMVHGLAGSAALVLVALAGVDSIWQGMAYIGFFGAGSILGMAALSMVIAVPLRGAARLTTGMVNAFEMLIGLSTVGIGLWVLYETWPV